MNPKAENDPSTTSPFADPVTLAWLETPSGDRFPIQSSCSVGRSATNQVSLAGEKVSRRHAVIQAQGQNDFWLTDLGSCNGTWLNGHRVSQATRLYDQDQIAIGPYRLTFRQPSGKVRSRPDYTVTERTIQEIKSVNCWLLLAQLESPTHLARAVKPDQMPFVMSRWLDECKDLIEQHSGSIHKYLGDGFLAWWKDDSSVPAAVARTLEELKKCQSRLQPPFHLALHYGSVIVGGTTTFREGSFSGSVVNFVFRMEKLGRALKTSVLVSEAAQALIGTHLTLAEAGRHSISGFEGDFLFYQF